MSVPFRQDNRGQIKHVVVLMLENRSFDHMVGYMKSLNSNIDGVDDNTTCPMDPANPALGVAHANDKAPPICAVDPNHSVDGTTHQIYGTATAGGPAKMDGFVKEYDKADTDNGADIMMCHAVDKVRAITTLASEFALFDRYYAGIPGPTEPNRMMFMSCTSYGAVQNDPVSLAEGYPQKTIFDNMYESGKTFKVYWSDFPAALILSSLRQEKYWDRIQYFDSFLSDAANGTLPELSWIEPRWFDFLQVGASDQHPPHDVRLGEELIAKVYHALRSSPVWNNTLFVMTYDEHGGFFDHVPPPINVPAPDDHRPPVNETQFGFDRLGVRVPMICCSPWIDKGVVVHDAPVNQYCHSSFSATLKDLFGLPSFLTKRDAWACSFSDIVNGRTAPRTDCPLTIPCNAAAPLPPRPSQAPLTDLQREVIAIARGIVPDRNLGTFLYTEHEGALFVQSQITNFLHMASMRAAHSYELMDRAGQQGTPLCNTQVMDTHEVVRRARLGGFRSGAVTGMMLTMVVGAVIVYLILSMR